MKIETKSRPLGQIMNGVWFDVFAPDHLTVDFSEEMMYITKRKNFLLKNEKSWFPFSEIREYYYVSHLFAHDFVVKTTGGRNYFLYGLPKKDVNFIINNFIKLGI